MVKQHRHQMSMLISRAFFGSCTLLAVARVVGLWHFMMVNVGRAAHKRTHCLRAYPITVQPSFRFIVHLLLNYWY